MVARFLLPVVFCFVCRGLCSQQSGLAFYRAGSYREAIRCCEEAIAQGSKDLEHYLVLAWALVAVGKYHEAAQWALEGRAVAAHDPRLIEAQAEAFCHLGRNEEALRLFQDYIACAPSGARQTAAYYLMGEIYLRTSRFLHADIAFSVALQLDSLNDFWWARLGYARERAGDYRYALQAYDRALQLNRDLADARRGRERVLRYVFRR